MQQATTFNCPSCGSVLRLATAVPAGKKIKCPQCDTIFAAWGKDLPSGVRPDAEESGAPPRRASDLHEPEPADDYAGARSRHQAVRPPRTVDEYGARGDRDADDDYDRPRPRRIGRKPVKRGKGLLIGLIIGGVLLLLGVGAFAAWVWPGFLKSKTPAGQGVDDLLVFVPRDTHLFFGADMGNLRSQSKLTPEQARNSPQMAQMKAMFAQMNVSIPTGLWEMIVTCETCLSASNSRGEETVIIKMPTDFNPEEMVRTFNGSDPHKVKDQVYYKLPATRRQGGMGMGGGGGVPLGMQEWFLAMPTKRILIVASIPKSKLEELLAADNTKPQLPAETLAMVHRVHRTSAWLALQVDDQMKAGLGMIPMFLGPNVPPDIRPMVDALQQLKMVTASMTAGDQVKIEVSVTLNTEVAARNLLSSLQSFWNQKGKPVLEQVKNNPFFPVELQAVITEATNSLTFKGEGATTEVSLEMSKTTLDRAAVAMQRQGGMGLPNPRPMGGFPRR